MRQWSVRLRHGPLSRFLWIVRALSPRCPTLAQEDLQWHGELFLRITMSTRPQPRRDPAFTTNVGYVALHWVALVRAPYFVGMSSYVAPCLWVEFSVSWTHCRDEDARRGAECRCSRRSDRIKLTLSPFVLDAAHDPPSRRRRRRGGIRSV